MARLTRERERVRALSCSAGLVATFHTHRASPFDWWAKGVAAYFTRPDLVQKGASLGVGYP